MKSDSFVKKKRKYLYVLLLEDDYYYVGQTDDITRRFRQHCEQKGEGSVWTFYYKPVRIVEYWDLGEYTDEGAMQFENRLTIDYMNKYGIDNVRGGIYVYSDSTLHYNLVKSQNHIKEGKITPIANEEGITIFSKIKSQLRDIDINKSYIYVLGLKDDCIYINKSRRLLIDLRRHFYSKGSEWSNIHRPIELIELIENQDLGTGHPIPFQNSIVKKYMKLYGWDKVRGGDFKIIDEKEHFRLVQMKMPEIMVGISTQLK